jgi:hypothetical protein
LSLSSRAWRKVDGRLVPPVLLGEAVQRPGKDVADRQPSKEKPERIEDGPHRRGVYAVRAWVGAEAGRKDSLGTTLPAPRLG